MKTSFRYKETIVTIICDDGLSNVACNAIMDARSVIELKIAQDPFFGITYDPYPPSSKDEELIRRMCEASVASGVGPMAGVAGAVAARATEALVDAGSSVAIVENGGDIAFYSPGKVPVGIYADHPVFKDMAFMMESERIVGVCSSSRTVGHSVSLGSSSISTVFSDDVILADCCATALGNMVVDTESLAGAVECIGSIEGISGCLSCCGDKVAMYGELPEMVPLDIGYPTTPVQITK